MRGSDGAAPPTACGRGRAGAGRSEGVRVHGASGFNLQGRYNDDRRVQRAALPVGESTKFKVPTLRHLMLTAPYGHHGEFADRRRSSR